MKILGARALRIPEIKVVRFARFNDHRGYFAETFRKSDFETNPQTAFLKGVEFRQTNESFSRGGTVRGLHFQWNPYMGKLVRPIQGHLVDLALDIRLGSPTFGRIIAHDMPTSSDQDYNEWIWIPPGFAHGTVLREDTTIEYFCSGEYSPGCEVGVSPLAQDLNWELCDPLLRTVCRELLAGTPLMTEKDRAGFTLAQWAKDERARNFVYAH